MALTFRDRCRQAQNGDSDAYSATFGAHHEVVFRVAFRLTGDTHSAEDILQNTTLLALTRTSVSFESAVPLRVWMLRVATNLARRHLQQRRTHLALPSDDVRPVANKQPGPERVLEAAEEAGAVRRALGLLSADDSLILALYTENIDREAIAEILACTPNAVGLRLFHARNRLHAALRRTDADLAARFPRQLRQTSVTGENDSV